MTELKTDTLLNKEDVASIFGVCTATIMNWSNDTKNNFPKPIKISDRFVRFKKSEIDMFLQASN